MPKPEEIAAIAKGLKAEGINAGVIRCADGTEIQWGQGGPDDLTMSELEKWKAKRNATS